MKVTAPLRTIQAHMSNVFPDASMDDELTVLGIRAEFWFRAADKNKGVAGSKERFEYILNPAARQFESAYKGCRSRVVEFKSRPFIEFLEDTLCFTAATK